MYQGSERRANPLTEEQLEAIAERAAEKALAKVYAEVGRNLVAKLFWIVGAAAIGLVIFLSGKGVPIK